LIVSPTFISRGLVICGLTNWSWSIRQYRRNIPGYHGVVGHDIAVCTVPTAAVIFAARTGVRRVAVVKSRSLLLRGCE
jgi:hypothetical protein